MVENVIEIEDLTVAYYEKPVLWDIDVKFEKNKITAIVGPNGAGKSTLVKSIMNLVKPLSGNINIKDVDKKDIAYVPQSGSVDWDFPTTVFDIVLMGRYGRLGWFKRPKTLDYKIVQEALIKVGMEKFSDRQISELSGGQQQRVFLARALAQEADIYILDEPLKGVDIKTEDVLMTLLKEITFQGKTVIVIHHDLNTVKKYFENVVMINISLIASGKVSDVFTAENIEKTYSLKV